MIEDREGTLWIGTMQGLARLSNGVIEMVYFTDDVPHPRVRAIREDPNGELWIGTNKGLFLRRR